MQVMGAALQLGDARHPVKNLRLDAQGLKVADLTRVGDALLQLPRVTWLSLRLLYVVQRPSLVRGQQAAAAARAPVAPPPPPAAPAAAAGPAAAAAPGAGDAAAAAAAEAAVHALWGPQATTTSWVTEPGEALTRTLLQGLPATALELRIKPQLLL